MSTIHLTPIQLDELALGADAPGARAHLEECADCRAIAAKGAELRAEFTTSVLPRTVARATKRRRAWWPALAAPVLALAAVLLYVGTRPAEDDLGIKGGPAWRIIANRAGETFPVHDGTVLAAGDRIRFVVTPNRARYLMIASLDGAGIASIYYPFDGKESAAIHGDRIELPDSVVLDAAPGPERVFAFLGDEPLSAVAVRDALARVTDLRAVRRLPLPGEQLSLIFEKKR